MSRTVYAALAAVIVVAIWMTAGWLTGAGPNAYLLMGVPLAIGYQRWIARRPLHALWVRDAPDFRLDRRAQSLALLLSVVPAYYGMLAITRRDSSTMLWMACAIFGAVGAGFALGALNRRGARDVLACVATAGAIGCALMIAAWSARDPRQALNAEAGVRSLVLYFPVGFVLEEVFFRGALDSHVHQPGPSRGWWSAIFVSALWGVWHLPIVPKHDFSAIIGLIIVHGAIGVPLSLWWRKTGNLAGPALAHALIDAVRNSLMR